ncbi:uncharacterized protein EI90DRAFT_2918931 [Cantharellus anzutake]|uniref:uncharacterized protein n=1 Tax=Cantharellus anzutake TaxID=1750568 RepID=UPI0019066C0A|nr:uncharacterized protein EI90DRAFT_2918931 [Cantharellus anzutake]KAF8332061.1 hypothetical protein EI90DRAFT_2918931 [Cantharellus anzutake]
MSSGTRKKSVPGINGGLPQIDTGVTNNLLKKPGSSAVPLYQQCSALGARLSRVHDFAPFLNIHAKSQQQQDGLSSSSTITPPTLRRSVDPVHGLWDCLALGTPLCFLFNLLDIPIEMRLKVDTDPEEIDSNDVKRCKQHIAQFLMGISNLQKVGKWDGTDTFLLVELNGPERNTNGFVKVVAVLSQLLDRLPGHVFMEEPMPSTSLEGDSTDELSTSSDGDAPADPNEAFRKHLIKELLDTERQYVRDLEVMQNFATALRTQNLMNQDTIHRLFLNTNSLLDFQRHFLIDLEGVFEQKWPEQRWGQVFIDHETEFEVYEPYCANFESASKLLLEVQDAMMPLSEILNPQTELPAFLIKPVQRICKYSLFLETLKKNLEASAGAPYPYIDEVREGFEASKRFTARMNEAQRRADNVATVKALEKRVIDWKGHHIANFGELKLDDMFAVNKSDVDRDYHVFLFEKIVLCCKEPPVAGQNTSTLKKSKKTDSLLKKGGSTPVPPVPLSAQAKKSAGPLMLKGRIFLSNVTLAKSVTIDGVHGLEVWWRGDDELEFFTLKCRTEEQMKMWEKELNTLINEAHRRSHAADHARSPTFGSSSVHPSMVAAASPIFAASPSSSQSLAPFGRGKDPRQYLGNTPIPLSAQGSQRLNQDDDASADEDFDVSDIRDGRTSAAYMRRPGSTPAPSHASSSSYGGHSRPATDGYPGHHYQRSGSSFRHHPPPLPNQQSQQQQPVRPVLKSQFSSLRLGSEYAEDEDPRPRAATTGHERSIPSPFNPRLRSISTPTAPQQTQHKRPQVPNNHIQAWSATASQSSLMSTSTDNKRGSGSSGVSDRSSGFSTNEHSGGSPITQYGSSSGSNISTAMLPKSKLSEGHQLPPSTPLVPNTAGTANPNAKVKIKVHYRTDIFVIAVPKTVNYQELLFSVTKKVRLCGGDRDDSPLRIKYEDEDNDMITLGSDEDIQMAFDTNLAQISFHVA